ncbi:hypothetical protein [Micromonospora chokoriensis]|uniref:hypothetical protein n=1 Tax=Micromonospora chokoriensis TaxID=356851 RepID=UPI0012FDDC15|nr:hypothetical protein [Micromonospora chokoriensis]
MDRTLNKRGHLSSEKEEYELTPCLIPAETFKSVLKLIPRLLDTLCGAVRLSIRSQFFDYCQKTVIGFGVDTPRRARGGAEGRQPVHCHHLGGGVRVMSPAGRILPAAQ